MSKRAELPMALRAAYMGLHRRTDSQLAKHGVTADQFVLMATLVRDGSMTQRELARRMPSDPSTVRAMLVLLEKRSLVERVSHPTDSRALLVNLTTAGKRKFKQLWKAGEDIRQEMASAIPPGELEIVIRNLHRLAHCLAGDLDALSLRTSIQRLMTWRANSLLQLERRRKDECVGSTETGSVLSAVYSAGLGPG